MAAIYTQYIGDATITLAIVGPDSEYPWKDNVTYSIRLPYVRGSESVTESGRTHIGSDLTVVRQATVSDTLRDAYESLCSFLSASAEAYSNNAFTGMCDRDNLDLFPADITEWAYQNSDELAIVAIESEERADAAYWDGIESMRRESGVCDNY